MPMNDRQSESFAHTQRKILREKAATLAQMTGRLEELLAQIHALAAQLGRTEAKDLDRRYLVPAARFRPLPAPSGVDK